MLDRLIKLATGRSYQVASSDLPYMAAKGGLPLIRGAAWSLLHGRTPNGFLLGPHVQFLMSHRLKLGRGVALGGFSYVDCAALHGITLGDGVTIREFAWIQGRSGFNTPAESLLIGERCYIGPHAQIGIGGPITIGARTQLGAHLNITAESHARGPNGTFVEGGVERKGVRIGDCAWIGNNVTILDGVEIGDEAVVGAGSVVTRSIPPRCVAFGSPARPQTSRAANSAF